MIRLLSPFIRLIWGTWSQPIPLNPHTIRNIAICPAGGLGDSITILPVIRLLKRISPTVTIDIVTIERNAIVFTADPDINAVRIIYTEEDWKKLRVNDYNIIFVLNWIHISEWAIRAWKIGGYHSIRVTPFHGKKYSPLFSFQANPIPNPQSVTDIYIALVEEVFGIQLSDQEKNSLPYSMTLPQSALDYENHIISSLNTRQYCIINYSLIHEKKQWHNEGYCAVAELLLTMLPHHTLLIIAMEDNIKEAKQCFHDLSQERCVIVQPSKNFLHTAALVRNTDFLFTVDTSFIHCCSAFGKPVFGLYIGEKHNTQLWAARNVPFAAVETENGNPIRTLSTDKVIPPLERFLRQYIVGNINA
jgi:ADP-heptose:LPS heptosyltransferase